jgi:hypothetical protein
MKSSGFKTRGKPLMRRTPLRATAPAKAELPLLRMRKCPVKKGGCGASFRPVREKQLACFGDGCAQRVGAWLAAEKAEAARIAEAKQDQAKREAMKSLATLRREAQAEFNRYIRLRDRLAGHGCICCGAPLDWHSTMPGGAVDAGHFVSRGSAPELAFDERNVNAQRKGCNRPGGAKRDDFRAGMVGRWGQAIVDELEGPAPPARLRADDYRGMKADYRARANALQKLLDASP